MKISFKIMGGYLVVSLLLISMSVLVVRTSAILNPVVEELDNGVNNLNVALTFAELTSKIVLLRSQLGHTATQFYFTKNPSDVEKYARTLHELERVINQIIRQSTSEDNRKIFQNLKLSTDKLAHFEKRFMDSVKEGQPASYEILSKNGEYHRLNKSITNFINSYLYKRKVVSADVFSQLITISDSIQDGKKELGLQSKTTLFLIYFASIFSILVGLIVSRSISKPIGALRRTTELLSEGDMSVRSRIKTKDEIGILAASFNTMVSKLQESTVSKDYLSNIIDSMTDIVIVVNADGIIQTVNPSTLELMGYDEQELIGKSITEIVKEEEQKMFQGIALEGLTKADSVRGIETRCKTKSGALLTMLFSGAVMRDAAGDVEGIVCVAQDITERKHMENMKNEFISTVSHELRTPLTAINGSLGLIVGGVLGEVPPKMTEMLTVANDNVQRLSSLINDLLDIQKIESGKLDYHFQMIEVMPFVEKAITDLAGYSERYNVRYRILKSVENVHVMADPHRLKQVMDNLISNASKFSPAGDTVDISVTLEAEKRIRISIVDHGPGIPESFQPKLFEKFTQLDSSDTRHPGGTGLGLSIVKRIVEEHDGLIGYITAQNVGTNFYFELSVLDESHKDADFSVSV